MKKTFKITSAIIVFAVFFLSNALLVSEQENGLDVSLSSLIAINQANANGESPGGGTDCWLDYTRSGSESEVVCRLQTSGGNFYDCKTVTDLSDYDELSTCKK